MKKVLLLLVIFYAALNTFAYDKKSVIERFTNASCGPCASINTAWYNELTNNLIISDKISQIIYNVSWPSSSDPMYIFNQSTNSSRRNYYGVNYVPWITINGTQVEETESAVQNTVDTDNAKFSPFSIEIVPIYYSRNLMKVSVKVERDAADLTTPENLKLHVAVTEKQVDYNSPPGSNGETSFFSICRKMLPDVQGTSFSAPPTGGILEFEFEFEPDNNFLSKVKIEDIRIVTLVQNSSTKEVYQSEMADIMLVSQLEAIFNVDEKIGVGPFAVHFNNFSTSTDSTSITSWEWDFENDGVIDSYEQEPTWVFESARSYDVSLTIKDGIETDVLLKENYIAVIENISNTLIVNGIDYSVYSDLMNSFYTASVCFPDNEVDVWDLFGDQGYSYKDNSKVKQTILYNQYIPLSVLQLYDKVIWLDEEVTTNNNIENGDLIFEYIKGGGNFLLASASANKFLNENLRNHCGISRMSFQSNAAGITSLDPNIEDMSFSTGSALVQFIQLSESSNAVPMFKSPTSTTRLGGFTMHSDTTGAFIYVTGIPQLYDHSTCSTNYKYIVENWLRTDPVVSVNQNDEILQSIISDYRLEQNYPNPFNPSTDLKFSIPAPGYVTLKVYDLIGNEIATLINQHFDSGSYSIEFDASKFSSGVYLYVLNVNENRLVKKMTLIK